MIDRPDPYPRELIDVWPLHDARQELLEEIVSQPGSEQSPSSRRILVPVGLLVGAAALLLVVGGAWAAISAGGSDGSNDADVAASVVSTGVDPTTAPTTATDTATTEPTRATDKPRHHGVRKNGVRPVTLQNLEECLRTISGRADGPKDYVRLRRLEERHHGRHYRIYVVRKDHRIIAVDGHCRTRVVRVGRH